MTTRVHSAGPRPGVATTLTAPRVTPPPARPFQQVLTAGAGAIVASTEAAVRQLPGGPLLAAAVRPGAAGPSFAGTSAEGPSGTGVAGGVGSSAAAGSAEQALARSQEMNLYYLELQERISAENRSYSTLSNVLKARHDTVKNAISNIR